MDDELEYRGSQTSNVLAPIAPNQQDIAEKGAIQRSRELLENRIAYYDSVDSLGTDEKLFSVKQQLAINQRVKFHLVEIKAELDEAAESLGI